MTAVVQKRSQFRLHKIIIILIVYGDYHDLIVFRRGRVLILWLKISFVNHELWGGGEVLLENAPIAEKCKITRNLIRLERQVETNTTLKLSFDKI